MAKSNRRVRYAVIGLEHIAQMAVLPAFSHAREDSGLARWFPDRRASSENCANNIGVVTYSYQQ